MLQSRCQGKSRLNNTCQQIHKEFHSDYWDLRQHLEWRAQQIVSQWEFESHWRQLLEADQVQWDRTHMQSELKMRNPFHQECYARSCQEIEVLRRRCCKEENGVTRPMWIAKRVADWLGSQTFTRSVTRSQPFSLLPRRFGGRGETVASPFSSILGREAERPSCRGQREHREGLNQNLEEQYGVDFKDGDWPVSSTDTMDTWTRRVACAWWAPTAELRRGGFQESFAPARRRDFGARFDCGIFFGCRPFDGQVHIGTPSGSIRCRTVRHVNAQERWDTESCWASKEPRALQMEGCAGMSTSVQISLRLEVTGVRYTPDIDPPIIPKHKLGAR